MTTIEIEGDGALMRKLAQMAASSEAALGLAANAGTTVLEELMEPRAPGPHVAQEEVKRTRTRAVRDVGPDKEHWYYALLERGAGPHTIRGNPLAFEGEAGAVFVRVVQHPGFAARPFMRPAFDEGKGDAAKRVGETLKGAIMS